MPKEVWSSRLPEKDGVVWEIPALARTDQRQETPLYHGTLVLDVDGTLTVPGSDYAIDQEAIETTANFLRGGGNLLFCTGATTGRIERSVLNPLYRAVDDADGGIRASRLLRRTILLPENGSAILIQPEVFVEENELHFRWMRLHERHVPDKEKLRAALEQEVLPRYRGSYLAGDHPRDRVQREYMVSLKGLTDTAGVKEFIDENVKSNLPKIAWESISVKRARTTLDFVHADSGKASSLLWVLEETNSLGGPVMGFGDLGDEFASLIPTINVNKKNPNSFRERGLPSIDLSGEWVPLKKNGYVVVGEGQNLRVLDRKSGEEVTVLRTAADGVIFAAEGENGLLVPSNAEQGDPIRVRPLTFVKDGRTHEVKDAGKGTAFILNRLMDSGYFQPSPDTTPF